MNEETFQSLKSFTRAHACTADESIGRATRLYEDLKLTGDDAIEFIIAYGNHFKVDLSKFMAGKYFAGDGMNFLNGNDTGKTSLTLADLEKGVIAGRLDDKVIST